MPMNGRGKPLRAVASAAAANGTYLRGLHSSKIALPTGLAKRSAARANAARTAAMTSQLRWLSAYWRVAAAVTAVASTNDNTTSSRRCSEITARA